LPDRVRRWSRLGILDLLVLLLIQTQCSQRNADVLYAAIPSWADSDVDGDDSVTPLRVGDIDRAGGHIQPRRSPPPRMGDVDRAGGHTAVPRPSPNEVRGFSNIGSPDRNPLFWDVIARAPPNNLRRVPAGRVGPRSRTGRKSRYVQ